MGYRFLEQLTHWTDPSIFTQPDQWKGFLSATVTAHEAHLLYMRNFVEEITKNTYNQGRLTLKDLRPDTFESNEKSKLSFRQWSDEFSSWVERIEQDFETMSRLAAQMREWDKDKFTAAAQQEYRLGAETVAELDKHILSCNEETYSRYRSRDCGWTPPRQQERLGTDSPTGFTDGMCKAASPVNSKNCRVFSLVACDREVGQRICSAVSKKNDAQRHRQSGLYESGPRILPQSA